MNHIGQENVVRIGGRAYRLSRLTRALYRRWLTWAVARLPDPLDLAERYLELLPCPELLVRVAEGIAEAVANHTDSVLHEFLQCPEALEQLFGLLLEKYHPDADWRSLFAQVPLVEILEWITLAAGQLPKDEQETERWYFSCVGLGPPEGSAALHPVDWATLDKQLFQNFYLTPYDIDQMTLPEIFTVARGENEGELTLDEAIAHSKTYHRLTAKQRLELARRKYT